MGLVSKTTNWWKRGAVCLLLSFVGLSVRATEPPAGQENRPGPAEQQTTPSEEPSVAEPEAQVKIRRALEGDEVGDPQQSNGDPLLDDVLQMIRRRGSILDGTALDPNRSELEGTTDPTQFLKPAPAFRAAESLLRSARLLEALPRPDASRRELIHRLRSEASRCLQDALSGTPAATPEETD